MLYKLGYAGSEKVVVERALAQARKMRIYEAKELVRIALLLDSVENISIKEWAKYSTKTTPLFNGLGFANSRVHFYMHLKTGKIVPLIDFKMKIGK